MLSFRPLPKAYFSPQSAPAAIYGLREQVAALHEVGVHTWAVARFNHACAALTADAFIVWLMQVLNPKHLVIGGDFRYGAGRVGDAQTLRQAGMVHGFTVTVVDEVQQAGTRVSSTQVRAALARGDVVAASSLLGRRYAMSGRVIRGQQLARTLDMPTANMAVHEPCALQYGIYACRVHGSDGMMQPAIASLGVRPTVNGSACWLEVHLFDFDGNLYGTCLHVAFVDFIRAEEKFDSLEVLKAQMHADAVQAKKILDQVP